MSPRGKLIFEIEAAGLAEAGFGGLAEGASGTATIGGYMIQQYPPEFADLVLALQGRQIKNYLQIGIAAGGAERFLCEKLGIRDLAVIDMGDHKQFLTWQMQNKHALANLGVSVTEHIGDSHDEEAERFLTSQGHFDLVGIDGDHTPAGVRMDWQLVIHNIRPGSLIWLHDTAAAFMRTRDNGPHEVCEKLKQKHKVLLEVKEKFGITLFEIA